VDEVQPGVGGHAEAADAAGVLGNFGLAEDDVEGHGFNLSIPPMIIRAK
jgi:hypothetical protein